MPVAFETAATETWAVQVRASFFYINLYSTEQDVPILIETSQRMWLKLKENLENLIVLIRNL